MLDAPLSRDIEIYKTLRERLTTAYDLEDDDPVLLDTLEGETNLHDRIAAVCREAQEVAAQADALSEIIKRNKERLTRLEKRSDYLRDQAAWAMQEAGLTKISAPDLTISVRNGKPKVVVTGDAVDPYTRTKTIVEPDKEAIKEALEQGVTLDFAFLSNPQPVLTVRSK